MAPPAEQQEMISQLCSVLGCEVDVARDMLENCGATLLRRATMNPDSVVVVGWDLNRAVAVMMGDEVPASSTGSALPPQ